MLRGFTDSTGVQWRVWEVFPTRGTPNSAEALSRSSLKETPFANGWLCFESSEAKRRLAPVPPEWEFAAETTLEQFCQLAGTVPVRKPGRFGTGERQPSATGLA